NLTGAFLTGSGVVCCGFCHGSVRNALSASEAVRATDVMVNSWGLDYKIPHFLLCLVLFRQP
ncbi:hypothetical protein, partial [Klebsiella pneumoniae]|uniref:hypothetical protein n=2 Tax=Enterobacteriaceae TaxID=543 RepID=UPI001D0DA4E6